MPEHKEPEQVFVCVFVYLLLLFSAHSGRTARVTWGELHLFSVIDAVVRCENLPAPQASACLGLAMNSIWLWGHQVWELFILYTLWKVNIQNIRTVAHPSRLVDQVCVGSTGKVCPAEPSPPYMANSRSRVIYHFLHKANTCIRNYAYCKFHCAKHAICHTWNIKKVWGGCLLSLRI